MDEMEIDLSKIPSIRTDDIPQAFVRQYIDELTKIANKHWDNKPLMDKFLTKMEGITELVFAWQDFKEIVK